MEKYVDVTLDPVGLIKVIVEAHNTFSIIFKQHQNFPHGAMYGYIAVQYDHTTESACGILTPRRDMKLIFSFLREVWGGGKGEGNVPMVRASTQPDTTVDTVRFCTLYTKVSSCSKSRLCPFYILVWYLLWIILN